MGCATERPRILSRIPGRVRVHLPGWTVGDAQRLEARLGRAPGVTSVQANPLTENVLIRCDPRCGDENTILAALQEAWEEIRTAPSQVAGPRAKAGVEHDTGPPAERRGRSKSSLTRAGVRGVLGHAAVDSVWFAAGFLGSSLGLPLAGLGPLHVLLDAVIWGWALGSGYFFGSTRFSAASMPSSSS